MNTGTLYLIPCPIVEYKNDAIPEETIKMTHTITIFVVERIRTARRWLRSIEHPTPIDDMVFIELDKNDANQDLTSVIEHLEAGKDVGLISEAGCPCIADPGHRVVTQAQAKSIKVSPLVGPNSILMALMASGFSGQSFAFHGYLSNKKPELTKQLRQLEENIARQGQTQLFMEAPYRNGFMLEQIVSVVSEHRILCVACDINAPTQTIRSMSIKEWKKADFSQYHKRPAIFVLGK